MSDEMKPLETTLGASQKLYAPKEVSTVKLIGNWVQMVAISLLKIADDDVAIYILTEEQLQALKSKYFNAGVINGLAKREDEHKDQLS